ncbi:ATP-dependent helicase HrpB [Paenibacillus sp. GCM10027626]|uniref:ATP-dependent helicase HrpB n=1 Tax=Paenibacillus sp. GCM10027626 TaxID=3273411 RepID=UPI00363E54DA
MERLPIESVLPELQERLTEHNNIVLVAAPGAGKTTKVPLALLDAPWLAGQRILMLEPRRIAARSAARFMAASLGEQPGETVGYRVRMDTKVGPSTRIEVITEGVLTRLLQADPALEGVGLLIFDEFHERHLHSDLGLALALQSQLLLREDLRLLVMSATLDAAPVAELLGGASVVVSEGRQFPVVTHYAAQSANAEIEELAARTIEAALKEHEGDILVFLPGAGEIRRLERLLAAKNLPSAVRIAPLYGQLSPAAQDQAISGCEREARKVVLATSIAESSVTVKGVRIVIDCGLSRVSRFSPRTGMSRLETEPVSLASADQRRGRAGREAPGVCYRLWSEQEHRRLKAHSEPEIAGADLAPLALELAAWGVQDPGELQWLDQPPQAAYGQALELLRQLGAIKGPAAQLTEHGKAMAALGMHPRLAHMVLRAIPLGYGTEACELAALLSDRDLFRGSEARNVDMRLRLERLQQLSGSRAADAEDAGWRRVAAEAQEWMRAAGVKRARDKQAAAECCGLLLALAYPDRIAQRRSDGRFLLRNGRGAHIAELQPLSAVSYIVAAELEDAGTDSRIRLAAPLALAELKQYCADQCVEEAEIVWDDSACAVRARQRIRIGAIVLQEGPLHNADPDAIAQALLAAISARGAGMLPWTKSSRQLQARMMLMHHYNPEWPDVSDVTLAAAAEEWLAPYIGGMRTQADLDRLNLVMILENRLSWQEREQLEREVPTHIVVPSGSKIAVDYSNPELPVLAVRLQEVFGWSETPRIAGGKLPITLHLLSPAQRPVQVTSDLASFWANAYFEVKKDLKGRYPKHYWPDNPLEAVATRRAKPRQ